MVRTNFQYQLFETRCHCGPLKDLKKETFEFLYFQIIKIFQISTFSVFQISVQMVYDVSYVSDWNGLEEKENVEFVFLE